MSSRTCTDTELLNASRLYPPSNTETKRPSEYFSAIANNSKVIHEKSSSYKFKLARGASAWASKPAEIINKSGLNFQKLKSINISGLSDYYILNKLKS